MTETVKPRRVVLLIVLQYWPAGPLMHIHRILELLRLEKTLKIIFTSRILSLTSI